MTRIIPMSKATCRPAITLASTTSYAGILRGWISHKQPGAGEREAMTQQATNAHQLKYVLDEADLPTQWYNIQADLKTPVPPVLHPGTGQPIGPQDLAPL